jgi:hypothetical protein
MLVEKKENYKNSLYDHEDIVGLLFSLYHMIDEKEAYEKVSNDILEDIKKLKWHEYDGEVMIFSYMLAHKLNNKDYISVLKKNIEECLEKWLNSPDYDFQRQIIFVLFGLAYLSDGLLIDFVKKYRANPNFKVILHKIFDYQDIESIALILYILGRLKEIGKDIYKDIYKKELIPEFEFGNFLRSIEQSLEISSMPLDLLAKIKLAKVESGLDKPFVISKYEEQVYQQVKNMIKEEKFVVIYKHLLLTIVIDIFVPLVLFLFYLYFPNIQIGILPTKDMLTMVVIYFLINVNYSLLTLGSLKWKKVFIGFLSKILGTLFKR